MQMAGKESDCKPCGRIEKSLSHRNAASFMPGFLLVILPKCPFCFMAFSSTMLLCGEGTTMSAERMYQSTPAIVLSALFCLAAIAGIAMVKRDIRTFYALLLAMTGSVMVMTSVLKTGGIPLYYSGTAFIFLGVWLNTSLLYILRKAGMLRGKQLLKVSSK